MYKNEYYDGQLASSSSSSDPSSSISSSSIIPFIVSSKTSYVFMKVTNGQVFQLLSIHNFIEY